MNPGYCKHNTVIISHPDAYHEFTETLSCFLVGSKNLLKLSLGHLTISTKIENAYLI